MVYEYITCNNMSDIMLINETGTESTIEMYPLPKYVHSIPACLYISTVQSEKSTVRVKLSE